jgi:hypothetical protein
VFDRRSTLAPAALFGRGREFVNERRVTTRTTLGADSQPVYRRLKLPDSDIRLVLQRTDDPKTSPKERMHLDLETNNVEAEVQRIEELGATRWDHQRERGHEFWVLRDPWDNEFCVLPPEFPALLDRRLAVSYVANESPTASVVELPE